MNRVYTPTRIFCRGILGSWLLFFEVFRGVDEPLTLYVGPLYGQINAKLIGL